MFDQESLMDCGRYNLKVPLYQECVSLFSIQVLNQLRGAKLCSTSSIEYVFVM